MKKLVFVLFLVTSLFANIVFYKETPGGNVVVRPTSTPGLYMETIYCGKQKWGGYIKVTGNNLIYMYEDGEENLIKLNEIESDNLREECITILLYDKKKEKEAHD